MSGASCSTRSCESEAWRAGSASKVWADGRLPMLELCVLRGEGESRTAAECQTHIIPCELMKAVSEGRTRMEVAGLAGETIRGIYKMCISCTTRQAAQIHLLKSRKNLNAFSKGINMFHKEINRIF